jgi:hypothetical protein
MTSATISPTDVTIDTQAGNLTIENSQDVVNLLIKTQEPTIKTDIGEFKLSDMAVDSNGRLVISGSDLKPRLLYLQNALKPDYVGPGGADWSINIGSCVTGAACK